MNNKLLFPLIIILAIITLFYCGMPNSKNRQKKLPPVKQVKYEENISFSDYIKQNEKKQNKTIAPGKIVRLQKGTQRANSINSLRQEEIKRREKAVFNNLKRQQYNQKLKNYTNAVAKTPKNNNIDNYLLANMKIDAPPTQQSMQQNNNIIRENYIQQNLSQGDRVIPVNGTTALSYKSKQEVFEARKKYVSESLFAYPGYEPSDKVFGQIEDGKPWISISMGRKNGISETDGLSEESRFINNPSLLVAADYSHITMSADERYNYLNAMPSSIKYNKEENLIEVIYPNMHVRGNYDLNGLNARDFGYKYALLDNDKSKNVKMKEYSNISNTIVEFKNFIHTGKSCGVSGGCNNGSPYQPMLIFEYPDQSLEVVLYIKLWREKPSNYNAPADINEKITILPKYRK